jgi:hypothetical protein
MRGVFVVILLAASVWLVGSARAEDGSCGPGCHSSPSGACVVDGWGAGVRVFNECPAGARPRRPCPARYSWKFKACFAD